MNRFQFTSGIKTQKQQERDEVKAIIENLDFLHDNYEDKEKVAGIEVVIRAQCDNLLKTASGDNYVKMTKVIDQFLESKAGTGIFAAQLRAVL